MNVWSDFLQAIVVPLIVHNTRNQKPIPTQNQQNDGRDASKLNPRDWARNAAAATNFHLLSTSQRASKMENPHEAEQAVLLERIIKNVVSPSLIDPKTTER